METSKNGRPLPHRMNSADIHKSALRFSRRGDWHAADSRAYQAAKFRGMFEKVTSHMEDGRESKPVKYSDELILTSALECKTRQEFRDKYHSLWSAARHRGLYHKAVEHMGPPCDPYRGANYQVYAYEFSDNHAYVGLTVNPQSRHSKHSDSGPVHSYATESGIKPNLLELASGLSAKDAVAKEVSAERDYYERNWIMLNSAPPGSLGSLPAELSRPIGDNNTVYTVIGAPGSGKSTICSAVADSAFYIEYDRMKSERKYGGLVKALSSGTMQERPILFDPTALVSTTIRKNKKIKFVLFAISETEDVIRNRLIERGGEFTENVARRNRRVKAIFNMAVRGKLPAEPAFMGTADEVLVALKERLCLA